MDDACKLAIKWVKSQTGKDVSIQQVLLRRDEKVQWMYLISFVAEPPLGPEHYFRPIIILMDKTVIPPAPKPTE